jgi:DNA-binding NarL/FixJ family response regulator
VSAAGLTLRERELVVLLREGLTNQEIAERLVISTGTVRTHLENIFDKLGVHTRTAAVARAFGNTRQDAVG